MGCCFSCFNISDNKSQSGEPNERTTLLNNPVSNNVNRPLFSPEYSDVTPNYVGDEQTTLNKILHQTSIDIIDVSVIPTHIETKDFMYKTKLYQRKLNGVHIRPRVSRKLLKDLPHQEKVLSEGPLPFADIQMMNDAFMGAYLAYLGVEAEPNDNLVIKLAVS